MLQNIAPFLALYNMSSPLLYVLSDEHPPSQPHNSLMDYVKGEKVQAMNKYKRNQLLHDLMLCFFIVLACVLFCSSPLWLPHICSFIKLCLFVYLPYVKAYMFNPKCLFIVCNVIVVILIGESRLVGSNLSPATNEIYEEYVSRSASLRKARAFAEKNDMQVFEKEANVETRNEVDEEEFDGVEESVKEDGLDGEDDKLDLPTEELNKRVEDFIARINRQRRLEASILFSGNE